MEEKNKEALENKFTIRERIALKLLITFMAILKPTQWTHEYASELKEVKDLIDNN